MHKVFVIDTHPVVREGIRRLIEPIRDLDYAGETDSLEHLNRKIAATSANIVILDPQAYENDIAAPIRLIQEQLPGVPILIFSCSCDVDLADHALQAGATGFLCKSANAETLIRAIRQCIDGYGYIQPEIAARLIRSARQNQSESRHGLLSARERQIFLMLANGQGINMIGDQLHISPKTVSTHKFRIMQKLGIESNYDLVRYALRHQLIDL